MSAAWRAQWCCLGDNRHSVGKNEHVGFIPQSLDTWGQARLKFYPLKAHRTHHLIGLTLSLSAWSMQYRWQDRWFIKMKQNSTEIPICNFCELAENWAPEKWITDPAPLGPSASIINVSWGGLWPLQQRLQSIPSLACIPSFPEWPFYSFILLIQVSAKGTQMEREKSGLGLDRKEKFTECQHGKIKTLK